MAGMLLACQPTPKRDVVVNRGDGFFEQKLDEAQQVKDADVPEPSAPADAWLEDAYFCPQEWMAREDYKNFSLQINAQIEFDGGSHPILRAAASDFYEQAETVERILSVLIPDADGQRQGTVCYEDLVAEMECYMLGRFDADTQTYVPYTAQELEALNPRIEELVEQMRTAPRMDEYGRFTRFSVKPGDSAMYHTTDGKDWRVEIGERQLVVSRPGTRAYPESWYLNIPDYPGGPLPTPYPNIIIAQEEAVAIAEDFFTAISDQRWAVTKVERAGMLKAHYNMLTEEPTHTQGYLITCMRKNGDAALFDYEENGGARLRFDQAAYAADLPLERVHMFVDESGIYALWWENPLEIRDVLADDIELLPFEQIQQDFLQAMKNGLSWADERPSTNGELNATRRGVVNRILLSYVFVQEKDAPGSYLMVPAWLFFYTTEADMAGNAAGYTIFPYIVALNAVDGSRIELG